MPAGIIRWLGLFLRHLFSTDHKVIGLLYGFTSLFFLLVGFILALLIRWQLAYPGQVTWIPPATGSTAATTKRPRMRELTGSGAGKRARFTP